MFAALAVAIGIGAAGYVLALIRGISLRATIVFCTLACLTALMFPVIFSSDVYAYAGYGNLALHGISPYAHARILLHEPLLDAIVWQWGNPPPMCVYGPLFVWIAQALVALLLPLGAWAPLLGLRIAGCAALVACGPLAHAAFERFGRRTQLAAAAGIALNPLNVWNASSGHNDFIALAIVLAGFTLAARSRMALAAVVTVCGTLVKAPAIAAAACMMLSVLRDRGQRWKALAGAAAGLCVVLFLCLPLEIGLDIHLARAGRYSPQFSLQYVLAAFAPLWFAAGTIAVAAMALTAIGARQLLRNDFSGAACIALALWCAVPNPYPWYAAWILPVAFLTWETPAAWAVIASTLAAGLRYYPESTWAAFPPALGVVVALAEFAIPVAFLIAYTLRLARWFRPESRTPVPGFARLRSP